MGETNMIIGDPKIDVDEFTWQIYGFRDYRAFGAVLFEYFEG